MSEDRIFPKEYEEAWNAYFYPGTETFINKLDIHDAKELAKKEAELTFERLVELHENPIEGNFDKRHLLLIHNYLFQDLYDWAGQYRTVFMSKMRTYFAPVDSIDRYLESDLNDLNESVKNVYGIEMFVSLIADYYIALLNIHPFREGNGRAIREFLREFVIAKSKEIGLGAYDLDWSLVNEKAINEAIPFSRVIKSPIENEIRKAIVPIEQEERHTK